MTKVDKALFMKTGRTYVIKQLKVNLKQTFALELHGK